MMRGSSSYDQGRTVAVPMTNKHVSFFRTVIIESIDQPLYPPRRSGNIMRYLFIPFVLSCFIAPNMVTAQSPDTTAIKAKIEELNGLRQSLLRDAAAIKAEADELSATIDSLNTLILDVRYSSQISSGIQTVTSGSGTLKAEPKGMSKSIRTTTENESVTVLGKEDDYLHLSFNESGERGWLRQRNVVINEAVQALIDRHDNAAAEAEAEREKERERQASLPISRAIAREMPLFVKSFSWTRNSANGIGPVFTFSNLSEKTIKYIWFQIQAFNSVGDPAFVETGGNSVQNGRLVGPILAGRDGTYSFEDDPMFYSRTMTCLELHRLQIEYTDGSTYTMVTDLENARADSNTVKIKGDCSVNL